MAKFKKIKIFYSWQSDSPKVTNQNAIRNSIRNAIKSLKPLKPTLDMPLSGAAQSAWNEIERATNTMEQSLENILQRLRQSYIEVDIFKTNKKAWQIYLKYNSKLSRIFNFSIGLDESYG